MGKLPHEQVRPFGDKDYAATRSHQDSQISNENFRAAAQAAILINGGAATAILAFLSKDKIDPYLLKFVPLSLLGFAFGVALATAMILCTNIALRYWGLSWRGYMVSPKDDESYEKANEVAKRWHGRAMWCFGLSVTAFTAACIALTIIFFLAPARTNAIDSPSTVSSSPPR